MICLMDINGSSIRNASESMPCGTDMHDNTVSKQPHQFDRCVARDYVFANGRALLLYLYGFKHGIYICWDLIP